MKRKRKRKKTSNYSRGTFAKINFSFSLIELLEENIDSFNYLSLSSSSSLLVVSTKVGGIPEVLPSNDTQSDIMILCEANVTGRFLSNFIFEIFLSMIKMFSSVFVRQLIESHSVKFQMQLNGMRKSKIGIHGIG